MSTIYLIRHGQAAFGAADYDVLSELGRRQAELLGHALVARGVQADLVVCGAMRRHRDTALWCLQAMRRDASYEEAPTWNEYDHEAVLGAYDPDYRKRVATAEQAGDPTLFRRVFHGALRRWASGEHNDDYPETWAAFCARVEAGLVALTARMQANQSALVFTSGGPIAAVVRTVLCLSDDRALQVSTGFTNASLTKLAHGTAGTRLASLNEHHHLAAAGPGVLSYR